MPFRGRVFKLEARSGKHYLGAGSRGRQRVMVRSFPIAPFYFSLHRDANDERTVWKSLNGISAAVVVPRLGIDPTDILTDAEVAGRVR